MPTRPPSNGTPSICGFSSGARVKRAAHHREPLGRALGALLGLAVDLQAIGIELERERFTEADERVAREALAALDALEQEARLERPELHVGRYRGIEIGRDVER